MNTSPKLTVLLPVDYDFPEVEFAVDGQEFFVRNDAGKWLVGQEPGENRGPVSAVQLARGLRDALARLEQRRQPGDPPIEQP